MADIPMPVIDFSMSAMESLEGTDHGCRSHPADPRFDLSSFAINEDGAKASPGTCCQFLDMVESECGRPN
jgi:hypothetical protein